MKSIREVYKAGRGPSSSHTMGPDKICRMFESEHPNADAFTVVLYGSLAKTGKGHGTDVAVEEALAPAQVTVEWQPEPEFELPHPNTMDLIAYAGGAELGRKRMCSIGGGAVAEAGAEMEDTPEVYPETSFGEIMEYCRENNLRLSEFVAMREGDGIWDYLHEMWRVMTQAIHQGLSVRGTLPGGLQVERKAQRLFQQRHMDESPSTRENRMVCAYAFAVSEQNAGGGMVVTAPTCGSCGVLPAVLKYMQETRGLPEQDILRALAVGGLVGNVVKTNASISGAECGCQAEVGTACSMAAAALGELFGLGLDQIEYAAEVALEHHLGLTCDPVGGLVQIPCIERNAVAAMRAINALSLANFLADSRKISFDLVVQTMYETGRDMAHPYRETAEGGLAKLYK